MEQILGNSAEAASYGQLAGQVKDAFNRTFFNAHTGQYANGTQTANAMALFLDLVPKEHREAVVRSLTNDIIYDHNTHLTTGFIGVKFLMPPLTALGRSDLAYDLAVQTTYPSWGYMLERGATTLWELWQDKTGPAMNSHDHVFRQCGRVVLQRSGRDQPGPRKRGLPAHPHRPADCRRPALGQRYRGDHSRHRFFILEPFPRRHHA